MKKKLLKIKSHIGKVSKDSTNPFFKSKYMDLNKLLEIVEPLLIEEGLLLTQPIINNEVCTIITDSKDDSEIVSSIALPPITDPQKIGSCITYFRRYTLKSLLAIQEEDDDGNRASKPAPQPITKGTVQAAAAKLNSCKDLTELKAAYSGLSKEMQKDSGIIHLKDELKTKLK